MEPRNATGEPVRKTAALPGFVSTTLLTSSDGLFGDNVEEKRISDAPAPSLRDADYKPLYDRLQEMKDQKDKDWKDKNNPFAPPKALDDEEVDFIRDLENRQADSQKQRKAQEQEDLAEYLLARESSKSQTTTMGAQTSLTVPKPATLSDIVTKKLPVKKSAAPAVVIKGKRKPTAKESADPKRKKTENGAKPIAKVAGGLALGGLVGYGSDSDSGSDSDGR